MTICPNCGFKHADDDFGASLVSMPMPNAERIILRRLIAAHGGCVRNDQLVSALYGDRRDGGPIYAKNNVEMHISKLREKLSNSEWEITNERFLGYRLVRKAA